MTKKSNLLTKISLILSSIGLISSCAKTPDVRLTLCQDLSQLLLNASEGVEWQKHEPIIRGYKDLEMQIQFIISGAGEQINQHQASCFYPYEQDDVGAETFATPTSAYSTYPSKMLLDGTAVEPQLLANSVNKVMISQGKKALHKIQEGINKAGQ